MPRSEGLDVLVLETDFPGGQAGSSSRIENYLGFPTGISGQELAARAYNQAQKFGATMLIIKGTRLVCDNKPYEVIVEKYLSQHELSLLQRVRSIESHNAKTCHVLKALASIIARPIWRRSCVVEKK